MYNRRTRAYLRYQRHAHISKKIAEYCDTTGQKGIDIILLDHGKAQYGRLDKNNIRYNFEHHHGRCDWQDVKSRIHMRDDIAEYFKV